FWSFYTSFLGKRAAPTRQAVTVATMMLHPSEIWFRTGSQVKQELIPIASSATTRAAWERLTFGTSKAMNIAYKGIPNAPWRLPGRTEQISAPKAVPSPHPQYGPLINPSIYGKVTSCSSREATLKVSSVIPKAMTALCGKESVVESFCERERDISK